MADIPEPVRIALEDVTPVIAAAFADDACLIWSGEHRAYWVAGGNGYTTGAAYAGRWTIADAYRQTKHCDPTKQIAFERVDASRAAPPAMDREAVVEAAAISLIVDLCGPGASQSATNVRVVEDHLRQFASTLSADAIRQGEGLQLAVADALNAAWTLCDDTENGDSDQPSVPRDAWKRLADTLDALEAVIPKSEQPCWPGAAARLLAARDPAISGLQLVSGHAAGCGVHDDYGCDCPATPASHASDAPVDDVERWVAERPIAAAYDDNRQYQVAIMAWEKRRPNASGAREAKRTLAAGRIIDIMTGGKFDWRSRLEGSDFLESADWLTALAYADAALSATAGSDGGTSNA